MLTRFIAAALTTTASGAPEVISIYDDESNGRNGNAAGIRFGNDGSYYRYRYGTPIHEAYWIDPQTNMDDYEIRATLNSGDTPDVGTLSTWESLDTMREWTLTAAVDDTVTCNLTIEIRWTSNNVVQDSATYVLTANNPTGGGGGGLPP